LGAEFCKESYSTRIFQKSAILCLNENKLIEGDSMTVPVKQPTVVIDNNGMLSVNLANEKVRQAIIGRIDENNDAVLRELQKKINQKRKEQELSA
jgi:hypothetical protein